MCAVSRSIQLSYPDHDLHCLISRIILRPTEFHGLFSIVIFGTYLPHAELAADREALLKTFYAQTKRSDVKFGEITWISHYRLVYTVGEIYRLRSHIFVTKSKHTDGQQVRRRPSFRRRRCVIPIFF